MSGKTTFTINLLKKMDNIIDKTIDKVIWCHSENNAIPQNIIDGRITYHKGIPNNFNNPQNQTVLIILDDLMMEVNNARICELFTKGSHHRNLSVILITQNIFHQGVYCRDISLNAKYMVIFKNPRDQTQFRFLARQIFPENSLDLVRIYKQTTDIPYGYLLIDLAQDTHDYLRFRTNIFYEQYCTVFSPLNKSNVEYETIEGEQTYVICVKKCPE